MNSTRYSHAAEPRGERRRLLDHICPGARILDVGCWTGAVAGSLVRRGVIVDGVEPEPLAAARAKTVCRTVHEMSAEEFVGAVQGDVSPYDGILFLDVLEHLVDPLSVLIASHRYAVQDATVYISLPNVAHWAVRRELLAGRWDYTDSGIMDRTHLRFFTRRTARDLIEAAGWQVVWESASLDRPPLVALPERWRGVLERWPEVFASQFLFRAQAACPARASA